MTLKDCKKLAFILGFQDATRGKLYRDSFTPNTHLFNLGLHAEYEAGWVAGRNR